MAVWSEVSLREVGITTRFDSEFYRPEYLRFAEVVSSGDLLKDCAKIYHPTELVRIYEEKGVQILLAQNVRANRLEFTSEFFMPGSVKPLISRSRILYNDVLMTRSGANFGDAAVYKNSPEEIYASADTLIIRPQDVSGGYLATFFNTAIGRALLTRGAYGAAQPHIAPNYLNRLRLPRIGVENEKVIDGMVVAAYHKEEVSKNHYVEAEALLLRELGLADLDLSHELTYERNFREVAAAGRYDAQYFAPRYQRAMKLLAKSEQTIGSVAPLAKRVFRPQRGKKFNYIEIGDLTGNGHAESQVLPSEEAPSRAQWVVKDGDVITSTVRPIRRLTAMIELEQDGFVCSSGFAVLEPQTIAPELLLVFLRAPIIAEILHLHTTATMYPAIATETLLSLPIAQPSEQATSEIIGKISQARLARVEAQQLLEDAKRRVEEMILKGE